MTETQLYIERLHALRQDLLKAMEGLNAAGLNWKPTRRETNSAFVLATHMLGSERHWIHRVVGGREVQRDRDAEFRARGKDARGFAGEFAIVAKTSEEILGKLTTADWDAMRDAPASYGARSTRWCILHLIEHYAEQVGQVSLTGQMWEEEQGTRKNAKKVRRAKAAKGTRKDAKPKRKK